MNNVQLVLIYLIWVILGCDSLVCISAKDYEFGIICDDPNEDMKAEKGKKVKIFRELEYQLKLERLKEARMPRHKWIPQEYALVTKFDILEVGKDGQIHQRLVNVEKKDG